MVAPAIIAAGITAGSSLLGGLLGGKKDPEVQKWSDSATKQQRKSYKDRLDLSDVNRDLGVGVRDDLMDNPAYLQSLSPEEREALGLRQEGLDQYTGNMDATHDRLYGEGTYMGNMIDDPTGAMNGIYASYENPFQQDVIDTSLAGMDRDNARALAERGASTASRGGISNTRGGVADAMQQQLHGMNRAELEAALRSEGFSESRRLGGEEINRMDNLTGSYADRQMDAYGDEWDATNMYADDLGAFGAEDRRIGDLNAEAERTGGRDAVAWYNSQFGTDPMAGVGTGGAIMPQQQSGWVTGAGLGANLASAYLQNSTPAT